MNKFPRPYARFARSLGYATVEVALVLPVILMLMLATAELGRAFYQYNTLTKSVHDGARFMAGRALAGSTGIIDTGSAAWTANIATAQNLIVCGKTSCGVNEALLTGLTASNVTVTAVDSTHVNVTTTYTYQSLLSGGIPTFGFGNVNMPLTLSASVSMRAL